ncbi:MAG: BrnT family toxin [Chloroflexi bacterium]|nr:BrnT family toxin [Chloroflexota bacterium]MYE42357.1 BrnT family toxin [Chloroflexota bacterium]
MNWTNWTWDPNKNRENIRKHRIDFPTALLVFLDLDLVMEEDYFPAEQRWRTIGMVAQRVLLVVHTLPFQDEPGRIISARKAESYERGKWLN